jgi:hypothetical protein
MTSKRSKKCEKKTRDRYASQPHSPSSYVAMPRAFPAISLERDERMFSDVRADARDERSPVGTTAARRVNVRDAMEVNAETSFVDASSTIVRDDADDVDLAWVSFANDAAVLARTEAEASARDAAFEEALQRVRKSRRAMARRTQERANARREYLEGERDSADAGDVRASLQTDDDEGEGGGTSAGWRGEFSARKGDPARAPRALPPSWTAPKLPVHLGDGPSEAFRREIADRAARASQVAEDAMRESDTVAELADQVKRLNSALSACERRESAAEMAATAEAERAAALEHQYLEIKSRLKARDSDVSELNKVMFILKKRVEELTDEVDEARRENEKHRMEIAELKVNDSELRRTVEKRAVGERIAQSASESTKRDILALQSKCRILEEENERLSARVSQSEENEHESSRSAQRFHQLAEASARENEILQRANDASSAENAQLREDLKELHKEVRELKTQMSARRANTQVTAPLAAPERVVLAPAPAPAPPAPSARPIEPKVTTEVAVEPAKPPKLAASQPHASAEDLMNVDYEHFDRSEYRRRMRDGSGFFYDMRGVDPPKTKEKAKREVPTKPRPGERFVPPPEPTPRNQSYEDWMRTISELEKEHMRLALERDGLEAQLNKLPPGAGRTMLEREAKASALERLDAVHKSLKDNRNALKRARDARRA